jgi:hypothetical protein
MEIPMRWDLALRSAGNARERRERYTRRVDDLIDSIENSHLRWLLGLPNSKRCALPLCIVPNARQPNQFTKSCF